jgi:nicotinamide riboside transporter PnuC
MVSTPCVHQEIEKKNTGYIWLELSLKSPYLHTIFGPPFTPPYALFQWHAQTKEIWLNLSMKCWNSSSNAQGSRVIIVVVQVGAVKIYVTTVKALRKKETTGWNSVYYQNWWFSQFQPTLEWLCTFFFAGFFYKSHPMYGQLRVLLLCFL